jgi:hypothetical protein
MKIFPVVKYNVKSNEFILEEYKTALRFILDNKIAIPHLPSHPIGKLYNIYMVKFVRFIYDVVKTYLPEHLPDNPLTDDDIISENANLPPLFKLENYDWNKHMGKNNRIHLPTNIWGPQIWTFLHCTSILIRNNPDQISDFARLLINFGIILPCGICSNNFNRHNIGDNISMPMICSQDPITRIFEMHNIVNVSTRKNPFPKDRFLSKYNLTEENINYITYDYSIKDSIYSTQQPFNADIMEKLSNNIYTGNKIPMSLTVEKYEHYHDIRR